MAYMNAIATVLAMIVFFGIVWWAFSPRRKKANDEAAHIPFDLPDEGAPSDPKKSKRGEKP